MLVILAGSGQATIPTLVKPVTLTPPYNLELSQTTNGVFVVRYRPHQGQPHYRCFYLYQVIEGDENDKRMAQKCHQAGNLHERFVITDVDNGQWYVYGRSCEHLHKRCSPWSSPSNVLQVAPVPSESVATSATPLATATPVPTLKAAPITVVMKPFSRILRQSVPVTAGSGLLFLEPTPPVGSCYIINRWSPTEWATGKKGSIWKFYCHKEGAFSLSAYRPTKDFYYGVVEITSDSVKSPVSEMSNIVRSN